MWKLCVELFSFVSEVKDEPVEERIPIAEEIEQNLENPDADDEDIRNESSDESSESEEEDEPKSKKRKDDSSWSLCILKENSNE